MPHLAQRTIYHGKKNKTSPKSVLSHSSKYKEPMESDEIKTADAAALYGYSPEDLSTMEQARDAMRANEDRIAEIRAWAHNAGIKKIGIAHCAGLAKEATLVQELLSSEFDTMLAGCKVGRIKLDDLLNDGSQTLACNPIGQVKMLEAWGSQLNIVVGLCLGHDMIFNAHSLVPTTTLIVKDRKFKHNPMQTLAQKQEL